MTKSLLFVILFITASFVSVFAQSESLKNDLQNSFKNFDIVRLNADSAMRQAQASRTISVSISAQNYELSLAPRDLRSSRYLAEDTTAVGVRQLEKTPLTTYKGKVLGETNSEVRLTIDDEGIEGYFQADAERYFIEPAKRYSEFASTDEFVVYRAEDVLRDTSVYCPQDLAEKLEDGREMVATQNLVGLRTIEIATEADYDFVQTTANSASQANTKILSILNMVEGVYESELNLTLSVVFQHTWSTADPFNGTNPTTLLNSFKDHWNANYPATQYPRDTAHLFTYKPNVRAQGFAFLGVVCNNPSFAYGLSGRVDPGWGWEEANFLVTTHEIAHNLGANHSDSQSSCGNTLMQSQLSGSTQLSFCAASRSEVSGFVAGNGSCLTSRSSTLFDFDGDSKTDIAIFRPASGEWWINRSSTLQTTAAQFGNNADRITPGDYTGDGKADVAVWRPSNGFWYILRSEDGSFFSFPFGANGDVPAPADYDADGKTDTAVFRPSNNTWYINQTGGGGVAFVQFGTSGDVPVAADYDGDGKADVAVFRPSVGEWWILRSTAGVLAFQFGNSADKPVPGDYTGDGKADVAIFRPSNGSWFILRSENNSFFSFPFGTSGDVPVAADYDGDGKFDASVFRPSANTWYLNRSTAGTGIVTFGANGDKAVPSAFVP